VTGHDAWRTAELRQAEAGLEAAVRQSERAVAKLRESPDFQRRLDNVEQYARSRAAPRALRDLQRRIDAGELSWHAIAAGKHLDDPDVRAVVAAGIAEPQAAEDEDEMPEGRGYAFMRFDPDAD
jgi:hypothetical protein